MLYIFQHQYSLFQQFSSFFWINKIIFQNNRITDSKSHLLDALFYEIIIFY